MEIYLVGGAVRDKLLNIPVKDQDWVVVGSTPQQMLENGYCQVGADFPVFLHPDTKEEYALARTERKSGHGYQGFSFDTSQHVTLEEDLSRRDLTINAMAIGEGGQLIDPFNGKRDLDNRVLRHVSDAFIEDPLRVLRVARFASRFHQLGFTIAPETLDLMQKISASGETKFLTPERVWQETQRALSETSPWVFFKALKDSQCLQDIYPEIDALFGVPQPEQHHPEIDTGLHTLLTLERASELSLLPVVRFGALTHDLGKALTPPDKWPRHIGHEKAGISPIKKLCKRCKIPNDFRSLAMLTSEYHTHVHRAFELKPSTILKTFKACDAFRRPERFEQILLCCKADSRGRTGYETVNYEQADYFLEILKNLLSISTKEIVSQGFKGKEIGIQLDELRMEKIKEIKSRYKQNDC